MYEGFPIGGADDSEPATDTFEIVVASPIIPIKFNGIDFSLSAANTRIRRFDEGMLQYNRAIVDAGDGTYVDAKLDDDTLVHMSESGFPTDRPERPDASDVAFLEGLIDQSVRDLDNFGTFGETS